MLSQNILPKMQTTEAETNLICLIGNTWRIRKTTFCANCYKCNNLGEFL